MPMRLQSTRLLKALVASSLYRRRGVVPPESATQNRPRAAIESAAVLTNSSAAARASCPASPYTRRSPGYGCALLFWPSSPARMIFLSPVIKCLLKRLSVAGLQWLKVVPTPPGLLCCATQRRRDRVPAAQFFPDQLIGGTRALTARCVIRKVGHRQLRPRLFD